MRELAELLFPSRCSACGQSGELLCASCKASLRLLDGTICRRCGSPSHSGGAQTERALRTDTCRECRGRTLHFATARSGVAYDAVASRMLVAWKEGGASPLAAVAADAVIRAVPWPGDAVLTSVPPNRDRRLWRGHDSARALARALAREWQCAVPVLLRRRAGGVRQRGLNAEQRQTNLAGAFRTTGRMPSSVCLIDDVYTTGATVSAAAAALRLAGADRVDVVTFARAIRTRRVH